LLPELLEPLPDEPVLAPGVALEVLLWLKVGGGKTTTGFVEGAGAGSTVGAMVGSVVGSVVGSAVGAVVGAGVFDPFAAAGSAGVVANLPLPVELEPKFDDERAGTEKPPSPAAPVVELSSPLPPKLTEVFALLPFDPLG
jgi:hypothetical protein